MGGGPSKLSIIDNELYAAFDAHCESSADSYQEITLENVNINASGNCQMNFINKAVVNSACDMGPILDSVAEMAANADETFVKSLQATEARSTNGSDDFDVNVLKIRQNLTAKCSSRARAEQQLRLKNVTISCNDNSSQTWGNTQDVRAMCLKSMLHDAFNSVPPPLTSSETSTPPPPPPPDKSHETIALLIVALLFVIALVLVLVKFVI